MLSGTLEAPASSGGAEFYGFKLTTLASPGVCIYTFAKAVREAIFYLGDPFPKTVAGRVRYLLCKFSQLYALVKTNTPTKQK